MEFIYHSSKTLYAFIVRARGLIKQILSEEAKISTHGDRFTYKNRSYPIHVVVFEHPTKLGYFNSDLWEIGLNKELLFYQDIFLKEVLRHEMAHYITFIECGYQNPHGTQFHSVCKRYGWNEEMKAFIDPTSLENKKPKEILQKVSKLLELGKSSNINEAQLAMAKAQELLLKHQLTYATVDETHIFKRIFAQPKATQKMQCISDILRQFFVYPVINHGRENVYLEIFGKEIHVEIGEYIALFLSNKLEELWNDEKRRSNFRGIVAKNAFFHGVTSGFIERQRRDKVTERALITVHNELQDAIGYTYPKLRKSTSRSRIDPTAYSRGKKVGDGLKINSPIKNDGKTKLLC